MASEKLSSSFFYRMCESQILLFIGFTTGFSMGKTNSVPVSYAVYRQLPSVICGLPMWMRVAKQRQVHLHSTRISRVCNIVARTESEESDAAEQNQRNQGSRIDEHRDLACTRDLIAGISGATSKIRLC